MERKNRFHTHLKAAAGRQLRRGVSLLLSMCMMLSMFSGWDVLIPAAHAEGTGTAGTTATPRAGGTSGTNIREADPSTMDAYKDILDLSAESRSAGRLWFDKTVFALDDTTHSGDKDWNGSTLTLETDDDGVSGSVALNDDFLHVFSALGSTQELNGVTPVRTVIVFDNSGSMYSNVPSDTNDPEKDGKWEDTRIAKTVDAINTAIDMLMLASQYNEVAVVLFGDGGNTDLNDSATTVRYHGNSTAVTILPMKHYEPGSNARTDYADDGKITAGNATQYLKAGWTRGTTNPDGNNPDHGTEKEKNGIKYVVRDGAGSGWVFVDNSLCKLTQNDSNSEENKGHSWSGKATNGWNGCGNTRYTAYKNGTTNIQAGMYQGMQELLAAPKIETIGMQEFPCIPSLVLLTDGAVTDAMNNWLEPKVDAATGVPNMAVGFVNDFNNIGESFTGHNDAIGKANRNSSAWNQFIEPQRNDGTKIYRSGDATEEKYELVASADTSDKHVSYGAVTYKYLDSENKEQDAKTTVAEGQSLTAMEALADQYADDQAYMVFTYLLTTAYYKQAVKNAYGLNGDTDWDIYTITVDMADPASAELAPGFDDGTSADTIGSARITTNPAMMNPSLYFGDKGLQWLKDKGYLNPDAADVNAANNTFYDDGTIGDKTVEGIVKAFTAWDDWTGTTANKPASELGLGTFRSIQSGLDTSQNSYAKKHTIKLYTADEYTFNANDVPSFTGALKGTSNNFGSDDSHFFPAPNHNSFYRVYAKQEAADTKDAGNEAGHFYIPTKSDVKAFSAANNYTVDVDNLDYDYVKRAYYANASSEAAESIGGIFQGIMEEIMQPVFEPVSGTNDLGVGDAVTYMDPIGKYMDVKDVEKVTLFGRSFNVTRTAVYSYQWNHQFQANLGKDTQPLPEGWYKGDPVAGRNGNDGVKCRPDETERQTLLPFDDDNKTYATAAEAWADGWVYRLSYENAANYVPTLSEVNNPASAGTKMQNTEYTFYRIDADQDVRRILHLNPAYLQPDENLAFDDYKTKSTAETQLIAKHAGVTGEVPYDDNGAYLKYPGVFALSDLRIWVEDSGSFSDETGGSGLENDTNYDEALWVNVPVNMLPLRKVTVQPVEGGKGLSYTANQDLTDSDNKAKRSASFPLRVFYTVGVSDTVLDENGRINIAANIDAEYIQRSKASTAAAAAVRGVEQGDVEFFSNWYNPLKRYDTYSTTATDYTYGDPVVTFSPSSNNRYYVFEKALPLYSKAYVFNGSTWTEKDFTKESNPSGFGGPLLAELEDLALDSGAADADAKIKQALADLKDGTQPDLRAAANGDIVLLHLDDLSNVDYNADDDPFNSNDYFFLPIEYYNNTTGKASPTKYVITRQSKEFGSAYSAVGIQNGDMLCWHDLSGTYSQNYPYISRTEAGDDSRGRDYIGWPLDANGNYVGAEPGKMPIDAADLPSDPEARAKQLEAKYTEIGGPALTGVPTWAERHKAVLNEAQEGVKHDLTKGDWVVCAKPGGLRVGAMAQNVTPKGTGSTTPHSTQFWDYILGDAAAGAKEEQQKKALEDYLTNLFRGSDITTLMERSWAYYDTNVTRTANNRYLPTVSSSSVSGSGDETSGGGSGGTTTTTGNGYVLNAYLGNNGRLTVPDTTLLITKTVEDETGAISNDEEFLYQLYLEGNTEPLPAIVVQLNAVAGVWQRQFHYIDLELDAQRFLQGKDGVKAMVSEEGRRVVTAPAESEYTYTYADNNEPYAGEPYYVYIGKNTISELNAPVGGFRVYHNNSVDGNGSNTADVTPEMDPETGVTTYYANTVYLVSQEQYTNIWQGETKLEPNAETFNIEDTATYGEGVTVSGPAYTTKFTKGFELVKLDPNNAEVTSEVYIDTPYSTASAYWTKDIYFGHETLYNKDDYTTYPSEDPIELFDKVIPYTDNPNIFSKTDTLDAIAANTAQFSLSMGWGLLFSSLDSGTNYRVTEKLTDEQLAKGYELKEIRHEQQEGSAAVYRPGTQRIPVYYDEKATYGAYYGDFFTGSNRFPQDYRGNRTENGLIWSVDMDGTPNPDQNDLHYEPFHHTNAVMWEYYTTAAEGAQGAGHHQPAGSSTAGTAPFYVWDEGTGTSTAVRDSEGNIRRTNVADNPSCTNGADVALEDGSGNIRHYMFRGGEMVDAHYRGEASGYIRNTGRYLVTPTVHFGVKEELTDNTYATTPMPQFAEEKASVNYTGVYSVFGDTGSYEESANFINTINNSKIETAINGDTSKPEEPYTGTQPGVQVGDTITYQIKWANGTQSDARVVIIDPLDEGVDFNAEGTVPEARFCETAEDANAYLAEIYGDKNHFSPLDYGHVVIWDLGIQPPDAKDNPEGVGHGTVTLTVTVNDKAAQWWDYDGDGVADAPIDAKDDYLVRNRATVRVADNAYYTDTVLNPVGKPDKTESEIARGEEGKQHTAEDKTTVTEGENLLPPAENEDGNTWHGPLVFVGDTITYKVDWRNYQNENATVTIRDPLDPNVRFVSAEYTPTDFVDANGDKLSGLTPSDKQTLNADGTGNNVGTVTYPDGTKHDTITYDEASHTVTYNLGTMPSQSSGTVTLVVEVLEGALDEPQHVDNTAFVKVGNDAEQQTKTVENPTTKPEKTEDTPGDGQPVGIGDEITYRITFHNYRTTAANVTVMDKLDPGVTYVSAAVDNDTISKDFYQSVESKYYDKPGEITVIGADGKEQKVTVPAHTVVWQFTGVAPGVGGEVTLTVQVNENARTYWEYNGDATEGDGATGQAPDDQVVNKARVHVDNDDWYLTEEPTNPVPEDHKEETKPGNGKYVKVGDQVTYEIDWTNYKDKAETADVVVFDALDPGVKYISAAVKSTEPDTYVPEIQYFDVSGTVQITVGETTETIKVPAHTVVWHFSQVPGQAKGTVTLTVEVLENAVKDWDYKNAPDYKSDDWQPREEGQGEDDNRIINQARVKVGNDNWVLTEDPENPLVGKTETSPGNGETVGYKDFIDYTISYSNDTGEDTTIFIYDKLDPGVDFVAASPENTYTYYDKDTPGVTLGDETVDVPAHTVIWEIKAKKDESGIVTLKVQVNDKADLAWDYDKDDPATDEDEGAVNGKYGEGDDHQVVNQARVKVGNKWTSTQKPTNPIPDTHKRETLPGDGETVQVGQEVTYEIDWLNHKLTASDVVIFDKLDPGVDYVSDGLIKEEGVGLPYELDPDLSGYYETAETIRFVPVNGEPVSIDVPAHTVIWHFTNVPAQTGGTVTLKVVVKDEALYDWDYKSDPNGELDYEKDDWKPREDDQTKDDDRIINQARVKVGNESWELTEDPENPLTDKVETKPGDGKQVQVGDTIEYTIAYSNNTEDTTTIFIYDKLDPGVDFVAAGPENTTYTYYDEDTPGVTLGDETVDVPAHTVIWEIKDVEPGTSGTVTLTVQVNDKAELAWDYNTDEDTSDGDDSATNGDFVKDEDQNIVDDHQVVNQARVKIGNDWTVTNKPNNPIPDKTETQAGEVSGPTLTPKPGADNTVTGPLVLVGQTITYQIHWENGHDTEADVTIRDPLDIGVDFVSADNGGTYDAATHTVTWTLLNQEAGAEGEVTLTVQVNENATPKAVVDNTAYVQVGNDNEVKTKTVENPTPHLDKQEVTPGNGVMVQVGDPITYEITWQNYHTEPARVIVMDTLDPGVDYDDCDNGGTYYPDGGEVPASGDDEAVTIPKHTVVWVLENQPAGAEGKVRLTVKVNKDAKLDNKYNEAADGFETNEGAKDFEVLDQARVKVGNDAFQRTRIVENPVPEKTETEVDHAPNGGATDTAPQLDPKPDTDNTVTGPLVHVGDEITYSIHWQNGHDVAATVRIVDALDPGVDFVSASEPGAYNAETHTVIWDLPEQEPGAEGDVTLTVRVNEKATPAGIVDNQASVKVNGDPFVDTEIVENPTPHLEKTEVTPGEGMQVMPGDEIDYEIDWHNYEEDVADVIVIDKLDPGVDFLAAGMNGSMSPPKPGDINVPETANLTVQLVGAEGVPDQEFKFTLEMTAPEGKTLDESYSWTKSGEPATGTWTATNNTFTLKPGQSLTLTDVPVGTLYTLKDENDSAVVTGQALGLYGSAVTVTVEAQPNSQPQPAALSDGTDESLIYTPVPVPVDPVPPQEVTPAAADETEGEPMGVRYKSPLLILMNAEVLEGPDASEVIDGTANNEGSTETEAAGKPATDPAETVPGESIGSETAPEQSEPPVDEQQPDTAEPVETDPVETVPSESNDSEAAPEQGEPPVDEQQPGAAEPSETDPAVTDPAEMNPVETVPSESIDSETAPEQSEPQVDEQQSDTAEPSDGEAEVSYTYTFSAVTEDLPEPGTDDGIALMAQEVEPLDAGETVEGFDPVSKKLDDEDPTVNYSYTDSKGRSVGVYYYAKAHTVVWLLTKRDSNEDGHVDLQVLVNEMAEKFWSYDNPDWGPDDNRKDDRVRNQAGVKVGNNPEVKTRIIENPTKPEKTETHINDTDVSRDLVADENGYIGPEVHVGDTITYRITWQNNAADENGQPVKAHIVIIDPLDVGVDFDAAHTDNNGRYFATKDEAITYLNEIYGDAGYAPELNEDLENGHVVIWDLGEQDARKTGAVTLGVLVTDRALADDKKVENQATVTVGNNPQQTNRVENPLEDVCALVVTKTVTGELGDTNRDWHFRVEMDMPLNGVYGDMTFTGGVAEFTLKHGESATALELPVGIRYTVTESEEGKDGYETTKEGDTGIINEGETAKAEFVNGKEPPPPDEDHGHLIVTKTVTGSQGDTNKDWHFRVELSDKSINGTFGDMNFTNGVAEFTLKHGQSAAAYNLPKDITYTVTETEANEDGYTTTVQDETGSIPDGGTAKAEFVNRKEPPPPEKGHGHLVVLKTVTGTAGDTGKEWHFRVELSDKSISGKYGDMTFQDGVAEFTLKSGQSQTALNLPEGITYTVTESEANEDGYTTRATGETGSITVDGTARVEFVNHKDIPTPPPPTTPTPTPTPTPGTEPTPTPTPTTPGPEPTPGPGHEPEPTPGTTPPSIQVPRTADDSPLGLWLALLAISALGLALTGLAYRNGKFRKNRKKQ